MKRTYQFPPTPEEVETINSDAVNALCKRIAEAVHQTNDDLTPPDIVWILLWCAQNYICVCEEDEDFPKAADQGALGRDTRRQGARPLTGEKFSPTRQRWAAPWGMTVTE
jgi:hypothetical protein